MRPAPILVHVDWVRDVENAFYGRERRLVRAALLYADSVEVQSFAWSQLLASALVPHYSQQAELTPARWFELQLGTLLTEGTFADRPVPRDGAEALSAVEEIVASIRSHAVRFPELGVTSEALRKPDGTYPTNLELIGALSDATRRRLADPGVIPLFDDDADARRRVASANAWEGALAAALLGELEAFPDATLDVILDVRERLAESRTYFRSALAEVARELAASDKTGEQLEPVVKDLRVRVVDPALQAIREDLQALGARSTLARVTSDPRFVAAATGWLSVGAASGSGLAKLGALAASAPVAPAVAAAAKEHQERAALKASLRQRPYWMLHAADDQLRRAP